MQPSTPSSMPPSALSTRHPRGLIGGTTRTGWRTRRDGVSLLAYSYDHLISWWLPTDQCAATQQPPRHIGLPSIIHARFGFTVTVGNLGRTSRYAAYGWNTTALRDAPVGG